MQALVQARLSARRRLMVGAAALGVLAAPGAALAACAVTTAGNVDCASTVTTDTTSTITVSGSYSDYQLIFNSGVAVTGGHPARRGGQRGRFPHHSGSGRAADPVV